MARPPKPITEANEARRLSTLALKTFLLNHINTTLPSISSLTLSDIFLYPDFRRMPYSWSFTNGYVLPTNGTTGKSLGQLKNHERDELREAVDKGWMRAVLREGTDTEGWARSTKRRKVDSGEGEDVLVDGEAEDEEDSKAWIHTDSSESGEGENSEDSEEEEEEEEEVSEQEDEGDEDFRGSDDETVEKEAVEKEAVEKEPEVREADTTDPPPKLTPKQVRFFEPRKPPTPKSATKPLKPTKSPAKSQPTPIKPPQSSTLRTKSTLLVTSPTTHKRKRPPVDTPDSAKDLAALLAENRALRQENERIRTAAALTFTQTFDFATNKQPLVVGGSVSSDGESVTMRLTSGRNEACFTLRLDDR